MPRPHHLFALLLVSILTTLAASAWAFPLVLRGKTLTIDTHTSQAALTKALADLLPPQAHSSTTPERIQYDYFAVANNAPLTLICDFDTTGRLVYLTLDAMTKRQNPVAQALVSWLRQQAGPGKKRGKERVWTRDGFTFHLLEVRNAGEDSAYRLDIARIPQRP